MGEEEDFSTEDYDDGIISCIANQVGYDHVPKYASFYGSNESLTRLNNKEENHCLEINKARDGFEIGDDYASLDGLECKNIKYLCAHPNMTDNWNHFMVVMNQAQTVNVRKVTINREYEQQGLKLHKFQKGVKLMDTFSLTDTG